MLRAELVEELINKYPELTYDGGEVLLPLKNPLRGGTVRLISVFSLNEAAGAVGGMYALSTSEESGVYDSQGFGDGAKVLRLVDKLYPRMLALRDEVLKLDPERDWSLLKSLGFVYDTFQEVGLLNGGDIQIYVGEPTINLDELTPYVAKVGAGLNRSVDIYNGSIEKLLDAVAEGNSD